MGIETSADDMKIEIKTKVGATVNRVKEGFDEKLFLSLSPPFPPVRVLRFDGCKKGDRVGLQLNFLLFKQNWESLITAEVSTESEFSFVDEGVVLPFFLKRWKHHHLVLSEPKGGSCVIDDISFSTGWVLTDYLMYPLLYFQFLYRKPIYRKVFFS